MSAAAASLAALALKAARRELSRKAAAPMKPRNWRLEGAFPLEARGKGRWHLRLDPADPLRLRHVPSGRCLCPAFREMDTDLASVPALARLAGKPFKALHLQPDSFPRAAVFHDALYAAGWCWAVFAGAASRAPVTRAQADAILYLCLQCEGATFADGLAYWNAVRAAGASHWKASREKPEDWPPLFEGVECRKSKVEGPAGSAAVFFADREEEEEQHETPPREPPALPQGDDGNQQQKMRGKQPFADRGHARPIAQP